MTNETNPGTVGSKDLSDALAWARNWMANASPEEKAMMWQAQRESWSNGPHGPTDGMGTVYVAAQSQPAATVQEVGREAQQKTVAQAVANIVGAPYDDWRHFTNEADAILARLAALTAEPAAKAVAAISANWDQQPSPHPDMGSGRAIGLIGEASFAEVVDSDFWSLQLHFGKGDDARDKMRAVSDALRSVVALPHKEEATPATTTERGRG